MIPPLWENRNFYKDLGVSRNANHQQVKDAYRTLIKELHPDVNSSSNRSAQFQSVTEAFNVINDREKRALYDSYTRGPEEIFDSPPMMAPLTKKLRPKLLVPSLLFIAFALLIRNLNYPATAELAMTGKEPDRTTVSQSSSAASGMGLSNLNQRLVLLVGPQGAPGVAGVAGKDGFIGLNGYRGRDGFAGARGTDGVSGAPGAPGSAGAPGANGAVGITGAAGVAGLVGPAGTSGTAGGGVVIVPLAFGDSDCALGGTKFISSTGATSYACNGASGVSSGTGNVSIGSCDSSVTLALLTNYSSGDFMMSGIRLSQLSYTCTSKSLTIIINVKSPGPSETKFGIAVTYELGDIIVCKTTLSLSIGENNTVTLDNAHCANQNLVGTRASFQLSDLSARDVKDGANALAIQILG